MLCVMLKFRKIIFTQTLSAFNAQTVMPNDTPFSVSSTYICIIKDKNKLRAYNPSAIYVAVFLCDTAVLRFIAGFRLLSAFPKSAYPIGLDSLFPNATALSSASVRVDTISPLSPTISNFVSLAELM